MRRAAAYPLVAALLLAGCANPSTTTYSARDVGQPIETTGGTVVSSRVVEIKGEGGSAGTIAGGAVGATTAGVSIGSGSGSTIAAVLGGLLGAGLGYLAEERLRSREGLEYVVQMDDGRTVTVVQNREDDEQPIPNGTPVLVQQGAFYSRVMEHPDLERGGGGWVDPDTLPPDAPDTYQPEEILDPSQVQRRS